MHSEGMWGGGGGHMRVGKRQALARGPTLRGCLDLTSLPSEKLPTPLGDRAWPCSQHSQRGTGMACHLLGLSWALSHRTRALWSGSGGGGWWNQVVKGLLRPLGSSDGRYPCQVPSGSVPEAEGHRELSTARGSRRQLFTVLGLPPGSKRGRRMTY